MSLELKDKVALVTGASRGIGKAIADTLASQGAIVIGTATSDAGAQKIDAELSKHGGCGLCVNVTDPDSVEQALTTIKERYGAPDILVNNAGITRDNLLMRMKDDEWQSVIDTNLTAIYRLSKSVLRDMMKARWGRIINISSIVGVSGNAGQTNYSATKAGVIGFSKSLANEIATRGITVNVVAPGFIDTDMTKTLTDEQKAQIFNKVPMGRLGSPQDIANAVLFLASPMGEYITGETLHVNGGMLMD